MSDGTCSKKEYPSVSTSPDSTNFSIVVRTLYSLI